MGHIEKVTLDQAVPHPGLGQPGMRLEADTALADPR
ncbi:hypothetical protein DFR76_106376 [Nocardia pseudobrasiliensis]|uniref:Uncharacterized protein n=1 Tax=Nocardia pseudobrasiliensis TaxID=45979 RepID=A0A370I809_9NOCA|nr:hypothetical protein DFR76_106376 [Nocardia pseudobrasiliensis]